MSLTRRGDDRQATRGSFVPPVSLVRKRFPERTLQSLVTAARPPNLDIACRLGPPPATSGEPRRQQQALADNGGECGIVIGRLPSDAYGLTVFACSG